MVPCVVKTPEGELEFRSYVELLNAVSDGVVRTPYWVAKCVGDDEETIEMRSLLLDIIDVDEIVYYKDGSFGPGGEW